MSKLDPTDILEKVQTVWTSFGMQQSHENSNNYSQYLIYMNWVWW